MKEALQEDVDKIEKNLDGLRIEKLVDKKEKIQTLAVRFILENHT